MYFFSITMAQPIGPIIFNYVAKAVGALSNPVLLGPIITSFVGVTYLGSIPFWFWAGKNYKAFMEKRDEENARLAAA